MIDYKEIFEAWKISRNPTPLEEELAQKRLNVCSTCEYKTELIKGLKWSALCTDCNCPLNKKAYTKIYNACTQKKWNEVDFDYLTEIPDKNENTLI